MEKDWRQIFGVAFTASGTRNFYGDGWPHHRYWKIIPGFEGFDFNGATHIAKTTTWDSRQGNMPLDQESLQPLERFPKCILVNPFKAVVLNSVGLSGPGAKHLFHQLGWHEWPNPFLISFMAIGATKETRLEETRKFASYFHEQLSLFPDFKAPVGLQVNYSCPNQDHPTSELLDEVIPSLEIFQPLDLPMVDVKLNVLATPEAVIEIEKSGLCNCITSSNTFPYGIFPDLIDWEKLFKAPESPLAHLGGGGLSGKPCFPIVCDWFRKVRYAGAEGLMKLSNGILSADDIEAAKDAGANGIEFGSVTILRPWRVQSIIKRANEIFQTGGDI